ncbi:tRNA (adenosine(37)-N6)-threonylcarbamoyltransferase complex dimerization subunit type 1 TsaB [Bdellovibrionota bacterium FG-2]
MKLLAWDTSSKVGAIVAIEWDQNSREGREGLKLRSEWSLDVDITHSDGLLWGIDQMLSSCRWKLSDIDVLGVGVGPGSFTGLRIGVTLARTLGHALKKPLVGVSSLAVLARPLADVMKGRKAVVIAATDACKGELFSLFGNARSVLDCVSAAQGDFPGVWKRGVEESVLAPEALAKAIKKKLTEGGTSCVWSVVGEGRLRYPEVWKALPVRRRMESLIPFADQIQPRALGIICWEAYQAGLARDALIVHPRYLRAPDAELKLKAGKLPAGPTRGD